MKRCGDLKMEEERKWIVYMHTIPNGKKYIGVTSIAPEKDGDEINNFKIY